MEGGVLRTTGLTVRGLLPNRWDLVTLPLVFGLFVLIALGAHSSLAPIETLNEPSISLSPSYLPGYALRTTLRMVSAMIASLIFTLIYGTLAAKSRRAEVVLIPILDILQSVPVLSYISFTFVFFESMFPGRVAGAEAAAVFAIFTSQAWNMGFSFYQSLRTVPRDLEEATRNFSFSPWQRFWRLEVPFAMPGLVWNMMMSMSGGWFFVVASEAITVGDKTVALPGVGSYLARAIEEKDLAAVGWVVLTMTVVILIYDQLMFRPLVAWSDKFRFDQTASQNEPESWFLNFLVRSRSTRAVGHVFGRLWRRILRLRFGRPGQVVWVRSVNPGTDRLIDTAWFALVAAVALYAAWQTVNFIASEISWGDLITVIELDGATLLRVVVLIAIASIVWVPIGVMIGLRPALAEKIQPLAQFLAAFPANLLYPVFAVAIVHYNANPDIWLSPLMILGTQWYILFNVIAGTTAYPHDFREAAINFRIRGWQWWRKVMLPGIFSYFITGAITASGGAWNASIASEIVQWGDLKVTAHGLGAYITEMTIKGDYPRIVLAVVVMSLTVTTFNRLFWRPLYSYAERRLRVD